MRAASIRSQARLGTPQSAAVLPALTEAEVVACLRRHGGLTTAELTDKLQVRSLV